MQNSDNFDVIVVGGSYSGLAAGMALGRSLRKTLIVDSGKPCNRQTPHSHNFITHDGRPPAEIAALAKQELEKYKTVFLHSGTVTKGIKTSDGFEIGTDSGKSFRAKKLIFATGVRDIMPEIDGLAECWGITVIHCPYCHGYEVRSEKTGILANGDMAFDYAALISNWTEDLTLFTNGKSLLAPEQTARLATHKIVVVEKEVLRLEHSNGHLKHIVFRDGTTHELKALYARVGFAQHCSVPQQLGCELSEDGYIKVDPLQKTSVPGVFACGDNSSRMRAVSAAVGKPLTGRKPEILGKDIQVS